MCVYCEELSTSNKMDARLKKYRQLLPIITKSNDFNEEDLESMACIIPPTPISMRQHEVDGFVSQIEIYLADDHRKVTHMYLPIKYCPMCGKEIE